MMIDDSFDAIMNRIKSHSSHHPTRTNDNSSTRSRGSPSNTGGHSRGYSGVGGYNASEICHMSPLTDELIKLHTCNTKW